MAERDAFDWLMTAGTAGAALVAFWGIFVALRTSKRQLQTAISLHNQASDRDTQRVNEARAALATILFVEMHNRAARCLLDGITWATKHVDGGGARKRIDCPKFRPFAPAVYLAVADRLTELPAEAASRVVRFYNALEAVDRQIVDLTEHPAATFEHRTEIRPVEHTTMEENRIVAARFHQILLPAHEALESLLPFASNSENLEIQLRDADRQYLGDAQVLKALSIDKPPLLRDAIKSRFDWFQGHKLLAKFVNYQDLE